MSIPPGVTYLDHTADLGMALEAPSLDALFHRAALGMLALLRGEEEGEEPTAEHGQRAASLDGTGEPPPSVSTPVELDAAGPADLLAAWLREILFLHETERRDYMDSDFDRLEPITLRARVRTEPATGAVREIKGVTYHGLAVEQTGHGWTGQVIFDV